MRKEGGGRYEGWTDIIIIPLVDYYIEFIGGP